MTIETYTMTVLKADNGKVISNKNGEILGGTVYLAKDLNVDEFNEVDKVDEQYEE